MPRRELVDLEVAVHHETARAMLVSLDGDRSNAVWVPKSSSEFEPGPETMGRGGRGTLTLPEWLALEKGLI